MTKQENKKRTVKKFAYFPRPVNKSKTDTSTVWVWLRNFYEDQEYVFWNDWQEGVGNNWKWSWRCKHDYRDKETGLGDVLNKMNQLIITGKIDGFKVVRDDSSFNKVEIYEIKKDGTVGPYVGRFLNEK